MGFLRSVTRAVRSVVRDATNIAKSALNIGLTSLKMNPMTGPLMGMAEGLLKKTGLGNLMKKVAPFFANPMAFMAMAPLALFAGLMGKAKDSQELNKNLQTVDQSCGGLKKNLDPQGLQNCCQITAHAQAQQYMTSFQVSVSSSTLYT